MAQPSRSIGAQPSAAIATYPVSGLPVISSGRTITEGAMIRFLIRMGETPATASQVVTGGVVMRSAC